jgi:hypothetical protein
VRTRRKLLLVLVVAVAAGAVVWFVSDRRPAPGLAVRIVVVGYTNVTTINPGTFPARGNWIRAEVKLRNEGAVSVNYRGGGLLGWEDSQTATGEWVNGDLHGPVGALSFPAIPPGSNITAYALLPTNTLRWRCGLSAEVATIRERAFMKVAQTRGIPFPSVLYRLVLLLPNKPGLDVDLTSGWFEVEAASDGPPQTQLLQPADTTPGR